MENSPSIRQNREVTGMGIWKRRIQGLRLYWLAKGSSPALIASWTGTKRRYTRVWRIMISRPICIALASGIAVSACTSAQSSAYGGDEPMWQADEPIVQSSDYRCFDSFCIDIETLACDSGICVWRGMTNEGKQFSTVVQCKKSLYTTAFERGNTYTSRFQEKSIASAICDIAGER